MVVLRMDKDAHNVRCGMKCVREGYSGMAIAERCGSIRVTATSANSGWGEYTAEENAEYLREQLIDLGITMEEQE